MKHEEALLAAEDMLREGLRLLRGAADILRGPDVEPGHDAMRTEMALSRAIDTLSAAPLPRRT